MNRVFVFLCYLFRIRFFVIDILILGRKREGKENVGEVFDFFLVYLGDGS